MNPVVKAAWVTALRSGGYVQGHGALVYNGVHCCLGVLCELYVKEHGGVFSNTRCEEAGQYDGAGLPNETIVEWAGLDCNNPLLSIWGLVLDAAGHNDSGAVTFADIADAIEAQL